VPATDWTALYDQLVARLEACAPAERTPVCLVEILRDQLRPKCLALLDDRRGPAARQLVWAHGFDLPSERAVPRGEDPLSWLSRVTGLTLFDRRPQAYVTALKIGGHRAAWLCVVSARRGQALIMERMYLAGVGAVVGRRLVAAEGTGDARWPATAARGAARPTGAATATLTAAPADRAILLKLAQAVESAGESIVICDPSGRIEYVNPAFERASGYSAREVIGKTPRVLKSGVHPPSVYAEIWKTILAGHRWLGTFVNRRKDGRLYDEEVTITPIRDDDNTITGFVSVAEDVTEKQQRERERKALARASLAATGALDVSVALEIILNSAMQTAGADAGGVVFVGKAAAIFRHPVLVGTLARVSGGVPVWLQVIETLGVKQPEPVAILAEAQLAELDDLGSAALMALRAKGEVVGVMFVAAHQAGLFSPRLHSILESLTNQAAVAVENALLYQDVQGRMRTLESLGQFTRALRSAESVDSLLRLIVEESARSLNATGAAVFLLDAAGAFLAPRVGQGQFAAIRGSFPAAESVLGLPLKLGALVVATEDDLRAFATLCGVDHVRVLALSPLGTSVGQIGVLALGRRDATHFSAPEIDLLIILSDVISTAIHRVRLREELEEAYVSATLTLAEAVDSKDSYVAGHALRTGDLAERVARQMGLPEDQIQDVRYGAIFHDVGKISIPERILKKAGPLSSEEWNVVHPHTIAGARILAPVARLARAALVVRHHHERWDGSGYPAGLRGEAIPLGARIVAVVDAYTAMIEERTYQTARTQHEALEELRRHAGTQFDPAVVAAFLEVAREAPYTP
jgi:PAS domain S-box-containing protein